VGWDDRDGQPGSIPGRGRVTTPTPLGPIGLLPAARHPGLTRPDRETVYFISSSAEGEDDNKLEI